MLLNAKREGGLQERIKKVLCHWSACAGALVGEAQDLPLRAAKDFFMSQKQSLLLALGLRRCLRALTMGLRGTLHIKTEPKSKSTRVIKDPADKSEGHSVKSRKPAQPHSTVGSQ